MDIYDCLFDSIGTPNAVAAVGWADGAAISGMSHDTFVRNNTFKSCYRGVELNTGGQEGSTASITNVVVKGNTILSNQAEAIFCDCNYWDIDISGNTIMHSYATNDAFSLEGIQLIIGSRFSIQNNFISRMSRPAASTASIHGIRVHRGTNGVIENNSLSRIGSGNAVGFPILVAGVGTNYYAQGISVLNNTIHDGVAANSSGILIGYGGFNYNKEIVVAGNVVYNMFTYSNFAYACYSLMGGSNIFFTGNTAYDTAWPASNKVTEIGLYISPLITNIVIGNNNFSGVRDMGISNACKAGNYKWLSMEAASTNNQVYW
jgi:hypothetical protein